MFRVLFVACLPKQCLHCLWVDKARHSRLFFRGEKMFGVAKRLVLPVRLVQAKFATGWDDRK